MQQGSHAQKMQPYDDVMLCRCHESQLLYKNFTKHESHIRAIHNDNGMVNTTKVMWGQKMRLSIERLTTAVPKSLYDL